MSAGITLVTVFIGVIAVAVTVAIWQILAGQQGGAAVAREDTYQGIAREAKETRRRITAGMTEISSRVDRVDRRIQ